MSHPMKNSLATLAVALTALAAVATGTVGVAATAAETETATRPASVSEDPGQSLVGTTDDALRGPVVLPASVHGTW